MAVSHHELMYIYYNVSCFYAMRTFDEFHRAVRSPLVQFTGKFFNITAGRTDFAFRAEGSAIGAGVQ